MFEFIKINGEESKYMIVIDFQPKIINLFEEVIILNGVGCPIPHNFNSL